MAPSLADPLLSAFTDYAAARLALLNVLDCPQSNRDPLAELSERLVAALVNGTLAGSPVQKGHDVIGPEGEKIEVKYLANPASAWVNEHTISWTPDRDFYALVIN